MLIIGCVLTMKQDRIQVNIAMAMQTFLDSKHIAFQKNISSITQETDISFDYLNSSVRLSLVFYRDSKLLMVLLLLNLYVLGAPELFILNLYHHTLGLYT